jgi:hypothetical protein
MRIEARNVGRGRYTITLRREDGGVAFVDELRPSVATQREKLVERCRAALPKLDDAVVDALGAKLLELADRPEQHVEEEDPPVDEPQDHPDDVAVAAETLASGDLLDQIRADLSACGIATDLDLGELVYLAFTSRYLADPVCVFVQGPSSTGKTFVGRVVASLMPPEDVVDVQGITENALYYMGDKLKHRVLLMGEWSREDDQTENGTKTQALRQLISDKKVSKLFTNTETDNGRPNGEQATTEGPVIVYATSTLPMERIFEEDENRFTVTHTDETPEATRKVLERKADDAAGDRAAPDDVLDAIRRRHVAMQRQIGRQAADVLIPFARDLAARFPDDHPRRRRDFQKVIGLLRASALLQHRQRQRDPEGRLIAQLEDYRHVHGLLAPFMVKAGPTPATMRKHEALAEALDPGMPFKREKAQEIWGLAKARASELIRELRDAGLLEDVGDWTYKLRPTTAKRTTFLPDPATLAV